MHYEDDLRALLINGEVRNWHKIYVAPSYGWLRDWDESWPLGEWKFFLKFLQAFDLETRREYLEFARSCEKRREYGAENVAADELDAAFFKAWWKRISRERGEKYFASKAAAVYFAFDDDLRDWYQNTWLADGYAYCPERDDVFLGAILADANFRVKTPEVVEFAFKAWVMPLVGSLNFLKAKRFGYNVEDFAGNVYQRVCGSDGRRKNFSNGVDYWLKERPTAALGDWFTLEATRVIHRFNKRQQRKNKPVEWNDGKRGGANAANFDENEISLVDMQTLFDDFHKAAPAEAALLASYFSGVASYDALASFWNRGQEQKIAGASLGQHCRRVLGAWRDAVEKKLALGTIPKDAWNEIFSQVKKDARADGKKRPKKERERNLLGPPKSENWRANLRFATEPTKDDAALFERWLENQRIEETCCFVRLYEEKTQRVGLAPLVRSAGVQRTTPCVVPRQNSLLTCGSPNLVAVSKIVRRYWRNKFAANCAATFWYESAKETRGEPTYWRAVARVPLFAESDAEVVGFAISGYRAINSWPVEVRLGRLSAPVAHGVAVFKLDEFRAEIERSAPTVIMTLRRPKIKNEETRWHVKREIAGKLLLQKPVLPDGE